MSENSLAQKRIKKETISDILAGKKNRNNQSYLSDCEICRSSLPSKSAVCLKCCKVFGIECEKCIVPSTIKKLNCWLKDNIYEYVKLQVRCTVCEKDLQSTYALERQKYSVVLSEEASTKLSSENMIARVLLPLKLTNLVLSGNLAQLQSYTTLRENFSGTDMQMIKAEFGDTQWRLRITYGFINDNNGINVRRPYCIEFHFGTIWRFDGANYHEENTDEENLCSFFNCQLNPRFVHFISDRMREIFKLLIWRIVGAVECVKEPTRQLYLLGQIRNYAVYYNNC